MLMIHEDSDVYIINQHRFNGRSFEKDPSSTLSIYTRVTIGEDEKCHVEH
jgi:hypothetical protein